MELNQIKDSIEGYVEYDLREYYRDNHAYVRDAEKICEYMQEMIGYIAKLEARIAELEHIAIYSNK